MKKNMLTKVFLVLLPAMAVLLATTADSVTVVDTLAGTTETYSYFDLVPGIPLQMCAPLAALLAAAAAILAVLYIVLKKPWCIRVLYWMAFLSATAATLPVLARGDVLVLPNTGLPLMMIAHWLLAAWLKKKPLEEEQPQKTAPRLKGR